MSKKQPNPNDPAKVTEQEARETPPEDVIHNEGESETSAEALAGEAIAGSDVPEARKAAALRQLPDADLLALAKRAAESEHWLDVARRSQAEFENAKKRLEREQAETSKYIVGSFAKELFAPIDNLERAMAASEKSKDFQSLYDGLKLTYQAMLTSLANSGLRPIDAQGKPFDPNEHEALMMSNDAKLGDNVVAQVFEKGWKLHDRVLRPAKVVVNKK
ncbi:Protein GrpE [Planctomycetaceae bacterium]|nr:Protein GrpE [Planctomycetaceae bacterium]